jgi:ketosteroid isomerase-like protein
MKRSGNDGRTRFVGAAVWIPLLVAALVPRSAAGQIDAATRTAIDRARTAFEQAIAVNDPSAMAAGYTSDARLFPPAADSVRGTAAIRRFFDRPRDYEVRHDVIELTQHGASVFEIGRWTQVRKTDGVTLGGGWYFWEWRRQPDGRWLVHRDVWSSGLTPAGTAGAG